jgi:hypothetical protein
MRWQNSKNPNSGWNYAAGVVAGIINAADHIARTGDTELYTYSTSEGLHWSTGGPKTLLKVLQRYSNIALTKTQIYASLTSTSDAALRIDTDQNSPYGSTRFVHDIAFAQANIYYKDPLIAQSYNRSMPTSTNYGGYNPWGGDWGNLPGARFMFAQMEGKVWPYAPILGATTSPAAPTQLTTVPK